MPELPGGCRDREPGSTCIPSARRTCSIPKNCSPAQPVSTEKIWIVLWGQFLPVPEERLSVLQDGDVVKIGSLSLQAIETTGHAEHHFAYLFEDVCFSGDIGGVRPAGASHLRLPMPPPEFNLEKWRSSLLRMRELKFRSIAPTHFGMFDDPDWHLQAIEHELDTN